MIKILLTTIFCVNLFANQLELSGTVISDNEKIITSRNMGYIKDVYVNEGSQVKKGDILYEIDSSSIDSNKKEVLLNLEILKNINQENKIPITSLVNSYIYEQLNEKSDLIKEFKSKLAKEQTEVKIRIYENEKKFLLESSKLTGTNSLNQEIRFRLLNTIYKKRFLSPNEMQTFYDLKYQIKMIGVNLNQISKKLNSNQQVNVDFLMESISKLDEKLNENLVEIKKVLNYTNSRTRA